jgi:phosphatidylinositol kinase/protein kinase (PI-3  family)
MIRSLAAYAVVSYLLQVRGCCARARARRDARRAHALFTRPPLPLLAHCSQVKDRHNGNLLVDSEGHLVHIDFGFLLGISPGGNLGFETASFKLTAEMIDVMGGQQDAEPFLYFTELVARGFLIAREHSDVIEGIVGGMADSGLPCFFFEDNLQKVCARVCVCVSARAQRCSCCR